VGNGDPVEENPGSEPDVDNGLDPVENTSQKVGELKS